MEIELKMRWVNKKNKMSKRWMELRPRTYREEKAFLKGRMSVFTEMERSEGSEVKGIPGL